MSWAEVKKINSDLSTPLDKLIKALILGGFSWSIETGEHSLAVPFNINLYLTAIAAGGGGGGCSSSYSGSYVSIVGGGGGGRGEYVKDRLFRKTELTSINFNMGTSGIGGANALATAQTSSGNGTDAGNLSINISETILLQGGKGGSGSQSSNTNSTGCVLGNGGFIDGGIGTKVVLESTSTSPSASGGAGGSTSDISGFGYGGNGGGGSRNRSATPISNNGSNGGKGLIVITWGAIRFEDIKSEIEAAIAGGATHGSTLD